MKLLVLASLLVAAPAFADDPSTGPGPTMFVDEPGTPGENLPPAPPPEQAPPEQAPAPKARMTQPLPHTRARDRDRDDGRLEKREDTVLVDRPGRGYGDDYTPWLVDAPVGALVRVRAAGVTEEGILARAA